MSIPDTERLYRRVPADDDMSITTKADGSRRPSSASFKDPSKQISVDRGSLTTPEGCLAKAPEGRSFAVVSITAGEARTLGLRVVSDPLPGNKAHAILVGNQPSSVCKKLAKVAKWEIPPTI